MSPFSARRANESAMASAYVRPIASLGTYGASLARQASESFADRGRPPGFHSGRASNEMALRERDLLRLFSACSQATSYLLYEVRLPFVRPLRCLQRADPICPRLVIPAIELSDQTYERLLRSTRRRLWEVCAVERSRGQ